MPRPSELGAVLDRWGGLGPLEEHAHQAACRIGVYGRDGELLVADDELDEVLPIAVASKETAEQGSGLAVAPVRAFRRVMGYVVVRGEPGNPGSAGDVANHGASVLGELCAREYELDNLSEEILSAYEELNLFYDLAVALSQARGISSICNIVLNQALRVIPALRAWIVVRSETTDGFRVLAHHGFDDVVDPLVPDDGIAAGVLASRAPRLVDDMGSLDPLDFGPMERCADRCLLSVPLAVPGRDGTPAVGVLQLCDKLPNPSNIETAGGSARAGRFTSGDVKLACAVASHGAILLENARLVGLERELRIARNIQESLLPQPIDEMAEFDVAGACLPASKVGGDYYDHVRIGESKLGILVADVSGHDLAAALVQTAARSTFRAAMVADPAPSAVLERANRALFADLTRAEVFLTAWLGCVDLGTGELAFSDAGHPPAMLYRHATGEVEHLVTSGVPIGVCEAGGYPESSVTLEPGDVLFVYTDGLVDARPSGDAAEPYGQERLEAGFKAATSLDAADIVSEVLRGVSEHGADELARDDRTVLVLKRRHAETR